MKDFKKTWEAIKRESAITESENELKNLFGERTFSKAVNEQSEYFTKAFGIGVGFNNTQFSTDEYAGLRRLAAKSKPYCK